MVKIRFRKPVAGFQSRVLTFRSRILCSNNCGFLKISLHFYWSLLVAFIFFRCVWRLMVVFWLFVELFSLSFYYLQGMSDDDYKRQATMNSIIKAEERVTDGLASLVEVPFVLIGLEPRPLLLFWFQEQFRWLIFSCLKCLNLDLCCYQKIYALIL